MELTRTLIESHRFWASTAIAYATRLETAPMPLICIDACLVLLNGRLDESQIPIGTNIVFIDIADSKILGRNRWSELIARSIGVAVTHCMSRPLCKRNR